MIRKIKNRSVPFFVFVPRFRLSKSKGQKLKEYVTIMRRLKTILLTVIGCFICGSAFSYTQCELTPSTVWLNAYGDSAWICFENGACIYKTTPGVSEKFLDRMITAGMTAITANKNLVVRYNDDNLVCSTVHGNTDKFSGFWYKK